MPVYKYNCDSCGLSFEKMRPRSKSSTCPCPSCKATSMKEIASASFSFNAEIKDMNPQNSGFTSIDHDFDRVIGQDSFNRWNVINERRLRKHELIAQYNADGSQIQKTPDGDYLVMSQEKAKRLKAAEDYHGREFQEDHFRRKPNFTITPGSKYLGDNVDDDK